jgi:hypothetical protein
MANRQQRTSISTSPPPADPCHRRRRASSIDSITSSGRLRQTPSTSLERGHRSAPFLKSRVGRVWGDGMTANVLKDVVPAPGMRTPASHSREELDQNGCFSDTSRARRPIGTSNTNRRPDTPRTPARHRARRRGRRQQGGLRIRPARPHVIGPASANAAQIEFGDSRGSFV